ncbi:Imm64 family immunity protein [Paenibacillus chitinolyticus]|uniref:Imm64 family immunity protein n=1 Tax=Paenibacillus chitinolyticus TaxID=79263 RepID=UPI00366DEB1F
MVCHLFTRNGNEITFFGNVYFLEKNSRQKITATETLIKLVAQIYPALQFGYAFCDHEAQIELSPREFKPERYSLSFWPDLSNGELKVTKSSWHINGLTERQE